MNALVLDTLRTSKALRDAGVDERQAEAITQAIQQAAQLPETSELASRRDLETLESRLKGKIEAAEAQIIMWIVGAIVAINGAFATVLFFAFRQ